MTGRTDVRNLTTNVFLRNSVLSPELSGTLVAVALGWLRWESLVRLGFLGCKVPSDTSYWLVLRSTNTERTAAVRQPSCNRVPCRITKDHCHCHGYLACLLFSGHISASQCVA